MVRAPVPEAPVHEDRNALLGEDNVSAAAEPTQRSDVDAVAAAAPVQFPS